MGRKTKQFVHAETNRVRRYIENPENISKTDQQLIVELQIKEQTFYDYKQRIRNQDLQTWLEIAKEPLESAALRIKKTIDIAKSVNKEIALNPAADSRARIEAAKKLVECEMLFYRMLQQGPTAKTIIASVSKLETNGTDRRLESLGTS